MIIKTREQAELLEREARRIAQLVIDGHIGAKDAICLFDNLEKESTGFSEMTMEHKRNIKEILAKAGSLGIYFPVLLKEMELTANE